MRRLEDYGGVSNWVEKGNEYEREDISRTTSADLSFLVISVCCLSWFFFRRESREEIMRLTCANLRVFFAAPMVFVGAV